MNLRECTTFVIDHRQETFSYVFPHTTVVKPIIRPEMVARVADLMRYAGAEIKVIREEDEMRVSRKQEKMNRNTHSQQEILRAVYEGRPEDVHGSVLNALSDRGLVAHDLDYGWHVTEQGMLEIPDRDVAPIEDAPKPLEYPARATKALAQRMVDEGLKAEAIVERVVIQPAPSIAIPIPSESERNMRRAAYASIRDGLHRALSAGQALVPILDSLEETDPLLNGGAG